MNMNQSALIIRDMQLEDISAVIDIYKRCFSDSVNVALGDRFLRTFFKQALEEDFSMAVVLKELSSGQVVAVAMGTLKPGYGLRLLRKHFFLVFSRILYGFFGSAIVRQKVFQYLYSFIIRIFAKKSPPFLDDVGVPLPSLTNLTHLFVAVDPDCHGRGYGTKILDYLATYMFEKGASRIVGSVSLNNKPSLKLHEKLGWKMKQISDDRVIVWLRKP
ncbi:MAG: GNAT family N-acetyltransferase [Phycisphaerae bacterium]|nr:GNAT family N-acetyltransferase [Phycisphaerae bacterium]